ncbi:hypothetical protein M569_11765, partial [Genlisea aurea]
WEKAVKAALNGETDVESVRTLTLDGAVKCINGRLPAPSLFERFHNLQHLSMANIGVSSLEQFPRLQKLQKLILSDNRIADGLENLVEAGMNSLTDLDLSNNRISEIDDLKPLTKLSLVSLDLYECPVTRVKDYQRRVFGLIDSLQYLDNMDADENERPESDEEEEEEEEEDDDDGQDHISKLLTNGTRSGNEGILDVEDYEKSDTDEEGGEIAETSNVLNADHGFHYKSDGFKEDNTEGEDD